MRGRLFDNTENVGLGWTDVRSLRDGLCLFVPGGTSPVTAARASDQDVVSVGVYDTSGDEEPRLLRSAHVPLRIRTNTAVLRSLKSLAEKVLQQSATDQEHGVSVEPTPLEFPKPASTSATPIGRLREADRLVQRGLALARRSIRPYVLFDHWRVGVSRCQIDAYLDPAARPTVEWLCFDDPYVYAADPFAVPRTELGESGDGIRIFFEHFDYRNPVGDIRSVTWSEGDGFGTPRMELSEAHHLSHPTLLCAGEDILMMPESAEVGCLTVYERASGVWQPKCVALSGFAAVDANVIAFEGRWWLFATDGDEEPIHDLHVFVADSPVGPWTPHRGNPVLSDPRWGRGAGTPFVHDGRLFRPTQDCTQTYGGAVVLTEITTLTMTRYAQRPVARVTARQLGGGRGVHTLSACGPYTLVDAKDQVLLPRASASAIAPWLKGQRAPA
ncbi:MAG: hypothetical protein ACI81R_000526 [Bradymonadia bacterium]|jgi:hypothetical protein